MPKIQISESFESLHETRYGHRIKAPLITINARLKAIGKIKEIPVSEIKQGKEIPAECCEKEAEKYIWKAILWKLRFMRERVFFVEILSLARPL